MQPDSYEGTAFDERVNTIGRLVSRLKHQHRKALKLHQDCSGMIQCPMCESGQVVYSIDGRRKHTCGTCSTPGCIEWRE